jgi:hypothetical protein
MPKPPSKRLSNIKRPSVHEDGIVTIKKEAVAPDARARAVLQGISNAQEGLRQSGDAYVLNQVRALLRGISRQAIDKCVQEGSLLAVSAPATTETFQRSSSTQTELSSKVSSLFARHCRPTIPGPF